MKYFAAVVNQNEIDASCLMPPFNILASYHYFKNKQETIKDCISKGYEVFIDSGAFSADNSGKEINIDEYCQFIIDTGVTIYAGLDVIGNAKATKANVEYMEKAYGLKPIPTFHMGSPLEALEEMMDYSYIALGGLVFSENVTAHCDRVWQYILKHNPNLRVHGFGLTGYESMKRYPWYSVDSSSFKGCKRFGRQNILWNGFDFRTFTEAEYLGHLKLQGYDVENMENKQKWFLYDFYSVQSYKQFAAHLGEINKHKKFEHLNNQTTLF